MKLKWLPVIVSFAVTALLLFGGWHVYHSYALQSPLAEQIANLDGVQRAETVVDNRTVQLTLILERDASLRRIMSEIRSAGASYIKDRELVLKIDNPPTPELDEWWSNVLFDIAEAMDTKNYSAIPAILNRQQDGAEGVEVEAEAEIDEQYVYIRLARDEQVKFIMLPRIPPQYVGWSNA